MRIECPICKTVLPDVEPEFASRPFCSPRCKLVDLGNWLSGSYRISTPLDPDSDELQAQSAEGPGSDGQGA